MGYGETGTPSSIFGPLSRVSLLIHDRNTLGDSSGAAFVTDPLSIPAAKTNHESLTPQQMSGHLLRV